jgi:colicin import membrane protein
VSADNFDTEETCDDDPEEDEMPKVKGSTKPDAVQAAQPKMLGDPASGEIEIPATGESCEEDTEQRRDAESRLKSARENEYRKRMDARLARDEHDREVKELERLEASKAESEHLERQRIKVRSTQEARKQAEQERKKAERLQARERAAEDARRKKAAKEAKLKQMGIQDKLDEERLRTAKANAKATSET